jgi:16S rRNA (guanine527-N7)-methyltransferase
MSAVLRQLDGALSGLGLGVPEKFQERVLAYLDLIAKWNRVYNLTAIRETDKALTHHVLDSLAVLPHIRGDRVADVGSGAGLPGVPIALARPEWQVTLIESNHKKSTFLRQAAAELGLGNATVQGERVESIQPGGSFDVVISRAFADLPEFARLAGHLVAPGGMLVAMKGLYPDEELALLPPGWRVDDVIALEVPGLDASRHLVVARAT